MQKEEQTLNLSVKEYDVLIRKAGTIREFDVNNSYGIRDYYWNYRKKFKHNISEQIYSKIIKEVISLMIDELKKDAYVVFPEGFGFLKTAYPKFTVKLKEDKLKVVGMVDWYKTIELWYNDEEAKENKQLIYKENYFTKIASYSKIGKYFKNKQFLRLDIKRSVHKTLTTDYIDNHTIKPIIYG